MSTGPDGGRRFGPGGELAVKSGDPREHRTLNGFAQGCLIVLVSILGVLAVGITESNARGDPPGTAVAPIDSLVHVVEEEIAADRFAEAALTLDEATQQPGLMGPMDLRRILRLEGEIARRLGEYARADSIFRESLRLAEEHRVPDDPETAKSILGLARVQDVLGNLDEAGALLDRCLRIVETQRGVGHPDLADVLEGLADHQSLEGDYVAAEISLRRALDIRTAAGGGNADIALTMADLGATLKILGRESESIELFRRAVEIAEEVAGPNHTTTASALTGLGHFLLAQRSVPDAERAFRRALEISEEAYGSPHPQTAFLRCFIGRCLEVQSRPDEAREYYEEGIAEATEIFGTGHPQIALYERRLGLLLLRQMRVEDAVAILEKCLLTLERQYGSRHPFLCLCLKGLAEAKLRLGRVDDARSYIQRALATYEYDFGKGHMEVADVLSLYSIVEAVAGDWDAAITRGIQSTETGLALQEKMYRVSSEHEAIMYSRFPRLKLTYLLGILASSPSVADTTLARIFTLVMRTHGQILDRLSERQRFLELADTLQYDEHVTLKKLVTALDPGTTLLHFVRFRRFEISTFGPKGQEREYTTWFPITDPYGYCVFRCSKNLDTTWDLRFFDLGSAQSLDSLIADYRRVIEDVRIPKHPSAREEAEYRVVARRLYESLWRPAMQDADVAVTPEGPRGHAGMVFLVPDDQLHLVDFGTLLLPNGKLLIEQRKLHTLSSVRDLLRFDGKPSPERSTGMLVVGNPAPSLRDVDPAEGGVSPVSLCFGNLRPPRSLPGAEEEARVLADYFSRITGEPVALLVGAAATEDSVKQLLEQRRMVHLATHGFFCDPEGAASIDSGERIINPLLLSGVVLGAGGADDGYLSAQEVVGCDLHGVEWVVLSACGSGLGRVLPGEGLFGFRRALEMAGAHTVVTALWRIDDAITCDLMERIYRYRLMGSTVVDALRLAELERLEEGRRRLNRIHPVLWGGIVAEGDWH